MELFDPKKEKYITRGIDSEIPISYQITMFNAIEDWYQKKVQLDYLQVFKLSVEKDDEGNTIQIIRHSQEVPELQEEIRFHVVGTGIANQIFAIDDGAEYYTLLLSSEY